jgi:hypothetical protein
MAAGTLTYLNEGAISLAAANWDDGIGPVFEATLAIDRGAQDIVNDLDFTAMTTGGISSLDIRPQFTGNIGTAAVPLKIAATENTAVIYYNAGNGNLYIQAANTADSNVNTNIEMSGGAGGVLHLIGGTFTNVTICGGTCRIYAGAVVTNLRTLGGTVIQEYNATANTLVDLAGGTVTTERGVVTCKMLSGTSLVADIKGSGVLGSTLFEQNGGMLDHRAGNIPVATFRAGAYNNQNARRASTVAGTSAEVWAGYIGAQMRSPGNQVTWTTGNITFRGSNAGPSYMAGMPQINY